MTRWPALLGLMMACLPPTATAQAYRCTGPGGTAVLQVAPCAGAAEQEPIPGTGTRARVREGRIGTLRACISGERPCNVLTYRDNLRDLSAAEVSEGLGPPSALSESRDQENWVYSGIPTHDGRSPGSKTIQLRLDDGRVTGIAIQ